MPRDRLYIVKSQEENLLIKEYAEEEIVMKDWKIVVVDTRERVDSNARNVEKVNKEAQGEKKKMA